MRGAAPTVQLLELADKLTHLSAICFDMWSVGPLGVSSFANAMGTGLRDIRISASTITHNYVGDSQLLVISEHCPNLERFTYIINFGLSYYERHRDHMTYYGVGELVRRGANLARLELQGTQNVGISAFETIATLAEAQARRDQADADDGGEPCVPCVLRHLHVKHVESLDNPGDAATAVKTRLAACLGTFIHFSGGGHGGVPLGMD